MIRRARRRCVHVGFASCLDAPPFRLLTSPCAPLQLVSNINACQAVAEAVRTTLGPRGMDKLIHDGTKVSGGRWATRWT
jgi:hypothetical protein